MAAAAEAAIAVRGLRKVFGAVAAVDGVDLDVRPGELFALVGPDGAGKSTTIRLLCGLLSPTAGDLRILGHDLRAEPGAVKARIGYLSQNFSLYGDLTVDENIEFFADIHAVRELRSRRDDLLRATQLLPFRGRLARKLSGGMKKKLALACTLVHRPGAVFLDEPTTGVDPVSRGELWAILGTMLEEGITVFLTTPYLDEADRCDRIGLVHRGRMVVTGTPAAIKARHAGRMLCLDSARPDQAYRLLRTAWPASRVALSGGRLRFRADGGDEETQRALRLLASGGLPAVARADAPTLEDAFVALVSDDAATGDSP